MVSYAIYLVWYQITSVRNRINNTCASACLYLGWKMARWSEDVVGSIKQYLTGKQYPENTSKGEKLNLRKRAKDFILLQGYKSSLQVRKKLPNSNGHRYQRRQRSSFSGMTLVTYLCMHASLLCIRSLTIHIQLCASKFMLAFGCITALKKPFL